MKRPAAPVGVGAVAGLRRRPLLAALAAAVGLPLFTHTAAGQTAPAPRGRVMVKSFSLPRRLFSSPVAWPSGAAPGFAMAVVLGEQRAVETVSFVHAIDAQGRQLGGTPWLRGEPTQIAPSNAVVNVSARGELLAIDLQGQARTLSEGRDGRSAPVSPALGLLSTAAVEVGKPVRAFVLLSRDFRPHGESRNALGLMSPEGRLASGFPAALSGIPETQPPVLDGAGQRAFVMLRTGQVDAFALATGDRLPGFPSAALDAPRPLGGFRLALTPDGSALLIATGAVELVRIDVGPGRKPAATVIRVAGRRIGAVATLANGLVGWDAANGELFGFDAQGRERGKLATIANFGDTAPFLATTGGDVALVGIEASGGSGMVEQLFAERAPPKVKATVNDIAMEEARSKHGVKDLNPAQELELKEELYRMKKSWLEKTYGLGVVDSQLRTTPAVRVGLARGLDGGPGQWLVDERIEGFSPMTGFSQCEHVLPVFWRDPRQGGALWLLVGLNATDTLDGKPVAVPAQVRAYPLPTA